MKKHLAVLVASAGILAVSSSVSAVTVTYDTNAPVDNVQISNALPPPPLPSGSGSVSAIWTSAQNKQDLGQTFRVEKAFDLAQIAFYVTTVNGTSTQDRPFSIIIESLSKALSNQQVGPTSIIARQTGVLPKIASGISNQYIILTLDTSITLDPTVDGTDYYGFRFSFDDDNSSSNVGIQLVNGNTFSNGVAYKVNYTYPGGAPTPNDPALMGPNFDMAFALIAIPEPSVAIMVGLGLVGILLRRRWNR